MSDRLNSYKNRGKSDLYRKRMKDEAVELRKAKKHEQLTKRRNFQEDSDEAVDDLTEAFVVDDPQTYTEEPTADVQEIAQALRSNDPELTLQAARSARKMLSKALNPPIEIFIKMGLVPRFVDLLSADSPIVQFEASWVLTNIASGNETQTRIAVECGVSESFLKLLKDSPPNVMEQVLWGLSNIAGTGAQYRDLLLRMGIMPVLVKLVEGTTSRTLLATAAWCLSNLCRKMGSIPDFESLTEAVPILKKLLSHDSVNVVSDACWALSYFTDGPNERIEAVSQAGIIQPVIGLLGNCNEKAILIPALRVIGNIVTGDDFQTQRVIDSGALSALKFLLNESAVNTKKEVVWALSNILAGNSNQIEAVLQEGLLNPLVHLLACGDYKCRIETTWALSNLTCGGTPNQIRALILSGALAPLSVMLECRELRLIRVTLDAFGNILRAARDLGILFDVMNTLEESGFVDRVEMLQMHENEHIYKRAAALISAYWSIEEEEAVAEPSPSKSMLSFEPLKMIPKFSL